MLKLFYAPGSCAMASHIALEEAGADYEAVKVDLVGGEQRKPDYLAINPKGRVPALVTDRGILTENPAILAFVAQTHPAASLAPLDDAYEFGRIQSFNSYLCSTVHVAHAHRLRAYRWADDPAAMAEMRRKVPQNVGECFDLIEKEMFKEPWVMGERYSVSDPYLFTLAGWLKGDDVDLARFPKIHDHHRRMQQRPAVASVLPLHQH